jgi:hypothetical protein
MDTLDKSLPHTPGTEPLEKQLPSRDLHPLAERTLRAFENAKPDEHGLLRPRSIRALNVHVTAECVERAIRLMDKLLRHLQAAGLKAAVPEGRQGLTVTIEGEELEIRLYELISQVKHVPTDEERVRIKKYPEIHGVPEYDERPAGKLTLAICREEFGGVRMRWVDGKGHPLETKLDSFLVGLGDAARAKRAWREAKEEQERQWQERRRKEEEAESRRWEDRARAEKLTQQVDDWSRGRLIRKYVADLKAHAVRPEIWTIDKVPLVEWMQWALDYADRIDPVAPIRARAKSEQS